ncbi:MAG: conjugal transfer protein TraH [Nitrospiria bacterium]
MRKASFLSIAVILLNFYGVVAADADMATDLQSMLNNYQAMSNATAPGAYNGQTQGYATAGALSVRIPTTPVNPGVTFTHAAIKGGCSGVDINLGGISYLTNPQQLVQKVQTILANSASVLFFLALQTLSPEIATINDMMNKAADFMNGLNMSSCHAAQKLVGLGIDTVVSDTTEKCALQRLTNGQSGTMEDARLACAGASGSPTNTGSAAAPGSELDPTSNFTYMAIQKYSYGADPMLTQEILSLIGAVIYRANPDGSDPPYVAQTFVPTIHLTDLILGTDTSSGAPTYTLYQCPNSTGSSPYTCTDMNPIPNQVISGFQGIVMNILTSIFTKLSTPYSGTASNLTAGELAFIGNSALPIYKSLNILSVNPLWGQGELPALAEMMTGYFAKIYIQKILDDLEGGFLNYQNSHDGLQLKEAALFYAERKRTLEKELAQLSDNSPEKIFYTTQYLETYNNAMLQRLPKDVVSNIIFAKKVGG